jgi:single-stranded-DNA-specific exonuclease
MKTWIEPEDISPNNELLEYVGGHPLVAEMLARRGITDVETAQAFLDPAHYKPASATDFPDMEKACVRIERAIVHAETILVWGDFDVDGQTSTTLLVEGLRDLGAEVEYHIPVRATEGHGIQVEVLKNLPGFENLAGLGLIVTCDTGITEHAAIDYAQSRGVDVIITDHHELAESLPNSFAAINPHRLPEGHPLRTLPGVGVAYKLVEELIERRRKSEDRNQPPIPSLRSEKYLDLVALGIVADVAEQTGDARYLLQKGLQVLRNTERLGLKMLYEIAEIIPTQLDEGHIGFGIGPRLNALGRLSDANPIVEFFTTLDPGRARILAHQLDGLNERRKLLTDQVYQGALAQIERDSNLLNFNALVLAHPGWPKGVIGIVASRLVEKFGLPTILLNIPEDDTGTGLANGSARSVAGVNIIQAIAAQAELLTGYGGHAGAAGMALSVENIPDFRVNLSRTIRGMLPSEGLAPTLEINAVLPLSEISLNLVDDLERLAPFGAGNPPLTMGTRNLKLVSKTKIGRTQEHLRLVVENEAGVAQNVLWWRGAGERLPEENVRFDLAFKASSNTFRGERRLQLEWVDFRLAEGQEIDTLIEKSELEIIDYRAEPHPMSRLNAVRGKEDIQVWAEGPAKSKTNGKDRFQITPGGSLAIWTNPPGYWELQNVLQVVDPQKIYLFAYDPELDTSQAFLTRLSGLVKHVLRNKGSQTTFLELAAALVHRVGTVKMGIIWLIAKGFIHGDWDHTNEDDFRVSFQSGDGVERDNLSEIEAELIAMLAETSAFRKYYTSADKNKIVLFE